MKKYFIILISFFVFSSFILNVSATNDFINNIPTSDTLPKYYLQATENAVLFIRSDYTYGLFVFDNSKVFSISSIGEVLLDGVNSSIERYNVVNGSSWGDKEAARFAGHYPNGVWQVIGIAKGSVIINDVEYNSSNYNAYFESSVPPVETPDYDSWAGKVFGEITSWFSGVLEVLASPFRSIADGLSGVWQSVYNGFINTVNAIKDIPQLIADKLEYLFVPSDNKFDDLKIKLDEKFGFVGQMIDLGSTLIDSTFGSEKPNANVVLYGTTVTIIDWDLYDNYRVYIHGIIVLLAYIVFIPKLIKKLPSVIRGI